MGKFGRRDGHESKAKSKLRHGSMGDVIFDHQEVCSKVKSFLGSLTNAAVSLANWSLSEENVAIQDTCIKMYEISFLLANVIESFSTEYMAMGKSLKQLLRQEMDLSDLNKKVCQTKERVAKLRKQNLEKEKKEVSAKRLSYLEDLGNAELEYEELKASFEAQNTKHEILKAKCLRDSLNQLADGSTLLGKRVASIGQAQKLLAGTIPVVPTQIRGNHEHQGINTDYSDEIVQKTADFLNLPRPPPFGDEQSKSGLLRKISPTSCFNPEGSGPSSPVAQEWIMIERPFLPEDAVTESDWRNQQGRLDMQMLSSLKDRLGIDSPHGRSYISNARIEQVKVNKSRGLNSRVADTNMERPAAPLPCSPKKVQAILDHQRVEPYAVSRWRPDSQGLYARADLLASGSTRARSRSGEGDWWSEEDSNERSRENKNISKHERTLDQNSKEGNGEVVYAVLEQDGEDKLEDKPYLDVLH